MEILLQLAEFRCLNEATKERAEVLKEASSMYAQNEELADRITAVLATA